MEKGCCAPSTVEQAGRGSAIAGWTCLAPGSSPACTSLLQFLWGQRWRRVEEDKGRGTQAGEAVRRPK